MALVVKLIWAVVPAVFGGQGGQQAVLFSLAFLVVLAALAALKVAVAEVPAPGMVSCWSEKSNLPFESLPQSSPRQPAPIIESCAPQLAVVSLVWSQIRC